MLVKTRKLMERLFQSSFPGRSKPSPGSSKSCPSIWGPLKEIRRECKVRKYKKGNTEFKEGKNCIYLGPDQDHYETIIQYEDCGQDQVNVAHTIVDSSFRGQGVTGKLSGTLVGKAHKDGFKLRTICSYAKDKLDRTQDYQDIYLE